MPKKGYIPTEDHRKKLSEALKRIMLSKEPREKIRQSNLRRYKSGEKFGFQKGHPSFHTVESRAKISKAHIHWANKDGKYKRSLADWLRLCANCHKNYDLIKA